MPRIDSNEQVAGVVRGRPFHISYLFVATRKNVNNDPMPAIVLARWNTEAFCRRKGVQIEYDSKHVSLMPAVAHSAHNASAPLGQSGLQGAGEKVDDHPWLVIQYQQLVTADLIQFKNHAGLGIVLGNPYGFYAGGRGA